MPLRLQEVLYLRARLARALLITKTPSLELPTALGSLEHHLPESFPTDGLGRGYL